MNKTLDTLSRFNSYQKERFPIVLLGLSLLPAILSSNAILSGEMNWSSVFISIVGSLAYLLHIRVIDEIRDFSHDNLHHTDRPVQKGLITKNELTYFDATAMLILVSIGIAQNNTSFALVLVMLLYSYCAGKEFFVGERIRSHFFIYNSVNLLQMLLMQIFLYSIFLDKFNITTLMIYHFAFTTVGTVAFEFVRKLKIPGHDGTGEDTYTHYLGFNTSMKVFLSLLVINALIFMYIIGAVENVGLLITILVALAIILALVSIYVHWQNKMPKTGAVMQLAFFSMYGLFNLIICYLFLSI